MFWQRGYLTKVVHLSAKMFRLFSAFCFQFAHIDCFYFYSTIMVHSLENQNAISMSKF